jgi:hypothetical protein
MTWGGENEVAAIVALDVRASSRKAANVTTCLTGIERTAAVWLYKAELRCPHAPLRVLSGVGRLRFLLGTRGGNCMAGGGDGVRRPANA